MQRLVRGLLLTVIQECLSYLLAASSAVPGVYPPTSINGRRYIDGSMSSGTNSDLTKDQDLVLIVVAEPNMTMLSIGPTMHRITFEEELKELKEAGVKVMVINPDELSLDAKGPNPLDARQRSASARQDVNREEN